MTRQCLALTAVFTWSVSVGIAQQADVGYHITKTYELGGDGGWDYIVPQPSQHRVYIGRTNRVMVVDTTDGKLIGEVTGIKGAHGTAIAESSGHGFATSGDVFATNVDGSLTVIHQDSADMYHVLGSVKTPIGSRNMGLDPTTHRIYVAAAMFAPPPRPPGGAPQGRGGRATVKPGTFKLLVIER
ncbi:MAG TPA: hypothetical protein VGJ78_03765 [Vicinamibacterales bacterium]|jgi:hypothetical protein